MGSITFANAIRTIVLNHIINYRISKKTTTPFHRIPAKTASSADRDGRTTDPLRVSIKARVTNTEKGTLELMETDRQVIDITDQHGNTYDNYSMESQEFQFASGYEGMPWIVDMAFLASSD